MTLAVGAFGKPDSYSYLAAKWAYGGDVRSLPNTKDVFDEIRNGGMDIGVVPLENISGGWISDVLSELVRLNETDPGVKIIREIDMPVVLCAATKGAKTTIDTAKKIYSHSAPLIHTVQWIQKNNPSAQRVEVTSTSQAAEMAARDEDSIALCNRSAARSNGLRVLLASIPSATKNITRFVSISKNTKPQKKSSMTSMWFSTQDKPGMLLRALEVFKKNAINLTRIESRAVNTFKSYRFFVEFEGPVGTRKVDEALRALRTKTVAMSVLGSYPVDLITKAQLRLL
jgi:chorismate mutase / prephenate dehydratase